MLARRIKLHDFPSLCFGLELLMLVPSHCFIVIGAGVIVDGLSLRKVPSEPRTAPVILSTLSQSDGSGFLIPSGQHGLQSQGSSSPKLHIDIPLIDDVQGV